MKLAVFLFLFFCGTAHSADIMYLGDSQSVGRFGRLMYDFFNEELQKERIELFAVVSSSPRHWAGRRDSRNGRWLCRQKGRHNLKTNSAVGQSICEQMRPPERIIESLIHRNRPEMAVFQFLGNSTGFNEDYVKKQVRQLLSHLPQNSKCVFITSPPHHISLKASNEKRMKTQRSIAEALNGRCRLIAGMNDQLLKEFATDRNNYFRDKRHLSHRGAGEFFRFVRQAWHEEH